MNRDKFLQVKLPFGGLHPPFTSNGKALVVRDRQSDVEHSDFLLRVALSDCESDNPFQDLGDLERLIFEVMQQDALDLKDAIENVFARFTDRFDLSTLRIEQDHEEGVASADITCRYTPFEAIVAVQDLGPFRGESR